MLCTIRRNMAKYYCTMIFSILLFSAVVTAFEIDYYWKDYDGEVPDDAFEAVINPDGTSAVYVGQTYIVNVGTLPGTLWPGATSVTITASGRNATASSNLKILATEHPCKLKWAKIQYNDIKTLEKSDVLKIVHGGEETNEEVYIGRHIHEGSLQVGKVYNVVPYQGLAFPNKDGTATIRIKKFEILLYIPGCSDRL